MTHAAPIRPCNRRRDATTEQSCRLRDEWQADCPLCREALYKIWYDSLVNERSAPFSTGGFIDTSAAFDALSTAIAMVADASIRDAHEETMW